MTLPLRSDRFVPSFQVLRLSFFALAGIAALALPLIGAVLGNAIHQQRDRDSKVILLEPPVAKEPARPVTLAADAIYENPLQSTAVQIIQSERSPIPVSQDEPVQVEDSEIAAALPAELPLEQPRKPFKRLDLTTEDTLQIQLMNTPEVSLDRLPIEPEQLAKLLKRPTVTLNSLPTTPLLLANNSEFKGLPFRDSTNCNLGSDKAEQLEKTTRKMHQLLDEMKDKETTVWLRDKLLQDPKLELIRPEAVPALVQMLQVERTSLRKLLVEVLGYIDGPQATQAFARRAIADLDPSVREAAARALLTRPLEDYRAQLLAGLRYPWSPVAVHAAETLAFVNDPDTVQPLVQMLRQPEPTLSSLGQTSQNPPTTIREVVRVNHLKNCLLCHPPSASRNRTGEQVLGLVPTAGQPLSTAPLSGLGYYSFEPNDTRILVHADTTYLKQDFSVMQPVRLPGAWPEQQRFDFMVRSRPATAAEIQAAKVSQLDRKMQDKRTAAVLFALREITGKEPSPTGDTLAAAR